MVKMGADAAYGAGITINGLGLKAFEQHLFGDRWSYLCHLLRSICSPATGLAPIRNSFSNAVENFVCDLPVGVLIDAAMQCDQ